MSKQNIEQVNTQIEELIVKRRLLLDDALKSGNPSQIIKAQRYWKEIEEEAIKSRGKSYLFDPYQLNDSLGYKSTASSLTYDTLRGMGRTPLIRAIITTRTDEVASFSQPQDNKTKIGWTIEKKLSLFSDKKEDITDEDKKEIERLINFIEKGGSSGLKWDGDDFEEFLRKIIRDTLEMDQMTFEVVRDHQSIPCEFFATDGGTYRISKIHKIGDGDAPLPINGYFPKFVQIYQGLIRSEFYPWELCFGIRNKTTQILKNGYGIAELEDLIKIITWLLNTDAYNGNFFTVGSSPKGIIKVKGGIDGDKLDEFRQAWKTQVAGVKNSWKTPILNADEVDWVDLQMKNNDMEFSAWQEYLIKIACAIYKIDPSEVGFFLSGSSGQSPTYESNNAYKLEFSKDKGLKPLMRFIAKCINKFLISELNKDFQFTWTGLENEDEEAELDKDIKILTNAGMSMQDFYLKYSDKQFDPKVDIILNQIYLQYKMMQQNGNPQNNFAVDQDSGESYNNPFLDHSDNPFKQNEEGQGEEDEDTNPFNKFVKQGAQEKNPFMKDLTDLTKKYLS